MTQTKTLPTATIIHEHGHQRRLRAAIRTGVVIDLHALNACAPDYEAARAEAEARFRIKFLVPRLGELS